MPATEAQLRANKKWRENHPEKFRATRNRAVKQWRENHLDEWYEAHKEYCKKSNFRRYHWRKAQVEFFNILFD